MTALPFSIPMPALPETVLMAALLTVLLWAVLASLWGWSMARRSAAKAADPVPAPAQHLPSLRAQLSQLHEALTHLTESQTELKRGLGDVAMALGQTRGKPRAGPTQDDHLDELMASLQALQGDDEPQLLNQALHLLQHAEPQQVAAMEALLIQVGELEQRRLRSQQRLASWINQRERPQPLGPGRLSAWQRLDRLSQDLQALIELSEQGARDVTHSQQLLAQWAAEDKAPS